MKKAILFVMVAVLVFSQMSVFATTVPGIVYSDETAAGATKPVVEIAAELEQAGVQDVLPTLWFAGSVNVLISQGLMTTDQNGNFLPDATLDIGTGVTVFSRVLGIADANDSPQEALQKAQDAGFVENTATQDEDLSRLGVARMLAKALGFTITPVTSRAGFPFNEFDSLSPEERGILSVLYARGIFRGFPNGSFQPDGTLTRAQIALLVDRLLSR